MAKGVMRLLLEKSTVTPERKKNISSNFFSLPTTYFSCKGKMSEMVMHEVTPNKS